MLLDPILCTNIIN